MLGSYSLLAVCLAYLVGFRGYQVDEFYIEVISPSNITWTSLSAFTYTTLYDEISGLLCANYIVRQ